MNNKAICPQCHAPSQLTLNAVNHRITIVCGACHQWWSIGEIEHTPYFFGGPKESNGPYELKKCQHPKDCPNPAVWLGMCEYHK